MPMKLPDVRHPRVFRIAEVEIELITYFPLTEPQAQALALHLWASEPKIRRAKGKRLQVPWLGDAAQLALLPVPSPRKR